VLAAAGRIEAQCHVLELGIYFEDTDLSGLVYHANYLRYMERGRSDLLACLGIDQRAALEQGVGVYAVAELAIRYRAPARFGDWLSVETRCTAVGGASVTMDQRIRREGQLLTDATVRAGFLTPGGRPQRQPRQWVELFRSFISTAA
jgi:acyl-CoA thioester hydrolase